MAVLMLFFLFSSEVGGPLTLGTQLRLQARARGGIHESFTVGADVPGTLYRFGDGAGLRRTERQEYEQADARIIIYCYVSLFLLSCYAAWIVLAVRSPGFRPGGGGHGSRSMERQRRGPARAYGSRPGSGGGPGSDLLWGQAVRLRRPRLRQAASGRDQGVRPRATADRAFGPADAPGQAAANPSHGPDAPRAVGYVPWRHRASESQDLPA